jgi:hypothetical protein
MWSRRHLQRYSNSHRGCVQYVLHFPKDEKYVSLLKDPVDTADLARVQQERARLRAKVKEQLQAQAAAGIRALEGDLGQPTSALQDRVISSLTASAGCTASPSTASGDVANVPGPVGAKHAAECEAGSSGASEGSSFSEGTRSPQSGSSVHTVCCSSGPDQCHLLQTFDRIKVGVLEAERLVSVQDDNEMVNSYSARQPAASGHPAASGAPFVHPDDVDFEGSVPTSSDHDGMVADEFFADTATAPAADAAEVDATAFVSDPEHSAFPVLCENGRRQARGQGDVRSKPKVRFLETVHGAGHVKKVGVAAVDHLGCAHASCVKHVAHYVHSTQTTCACLISCCDLKCCQGSCPSLHGDGEIKKSLTLPSSTTALTLPRRCLRNECLCACHMHA